MAVASITEFSTVDYPNEISMVIWFRGCNLTCSYCHNKGLLKQPFIHLSTVLKRIERNAMNVGAVVLSGGEFTMASMGELVAICQKAKACGLKVKLDTNGLKKRKINALLNMGLIDFVALDIKGLQRNIGKIVGFDGVKYNALVCDVFLTLNAYKNSNPSFDFLVRTTTGEHLHTLDDLLQIKAFVEDWASSRITWILHEKNIHMHAKI